MQRTGGRAEAPATGQTIFDWFPQAAGAHAYRVAAVELLARTGGTDRALDSLDPSDEARDARLPEPALTKA